MRCLAAQAILQLKLIAKVGYAVNYDNHHIQSILKSCANGYDIVVPMHL